MILVPRRLQVAAAKDPAGPFGAFERVQFDGFPRDADTEANVYFGAVSLNPVDADSLLGLFPLNAAGFTFEPPRANASCIAAAFSCDGRRFSPLRCVLDVEAAPDGRTTDHPVDGFVRRGGDAFFYVQTNARLRRLRFPTPDRPRAGRGTAAAGTWIFRGCAPPRLGRGYSVDGSHRRGWDVDSPWKSQRWVGRRSRTSRRTASRV